jgi:hypothetical protein
VLAGKWTLINIGGRSEMATREKAQTTVPTESRAGIISAVTTPLGFFVLVVLVIEALISALALSIHADQRIEVLRYMIILAAGLVLTTSLIAYFNPDALYGKRSAIRDAVQRAQMREPQITSDEAIAKAERFAHLIGALIVIKTIYAARRGNDGLDYVMTDLRKRMYGYRAIFGGEKVQGTNRSLSQLVGAVLNSSGTLDDVERYVAEYLAVAKYGVLDAEGNVSFYEPKPIDMNVETDDDSPEYMKKFVIQSTRIDRVLAAEGSENLYNRIVNTLWRNFETAILSGGETLPGRIADTSLEQQFERDWQESSRTRGSASHEKKSSV